MRLRQAGEGPPKWSLHLCRHERVARYKSRSITPAGLGTYLRYVMKLEVVEILCTPPQRGRRIQGSAAMPCPALRCAALMKKDPELQEPKTVSRPPLLTRPVQAEQSVGSPILDQLTITSRIQGTGHRQMTKADKAERNDSAVTGRDRLWQELTGSDKAPAGLKKSKER